VAGASSGRGVDLRRFATRRIETKKLH
jgi:hypothetical protein